MSAARLRLIVVLSAIATVAACSASDSVAPRQLKPVPSTRDEGDSIPNPLCKSGYQNPNGRCIGDE
ncbi:MAG: hypothetical protein V4550_10400 [Gemmatimonadota bacterium]